MAESRQNFRALHAFEVVSRHLSVAAAAAELGVTQSAVSHQLRMLSDLVGEKLTQKSGRGIILTEAGKRLAQKLQPAFAEINQSVATVIGGARNKVRLAVCSSFGPGWLAPRLHRFYETYPEIDLQILMYSSDPELTDAVGDAFVTTLPKDRGYHALFLWPERLLPVVSPNLIESHENQISLITTDMTPGNIGCDWKAHYLELGNGELDDTSTRWLFTSHYIIALEMVRRDLGAALLPDFLVRDDLVHGNLILLDNTPTTTGEDYHLCIKQSRRNEPGLMALESWFRSELALSKGVPKQPLMAGVGTIFHPAKAASE